MVAKHFPEPSFRPIASNGIAYCRPRSHKPHSRSGRDWAALFSRRWTLGNPQNKTAAMVAAAMGSHFGEICRPSQVRFGSEAHRMPAVIKDGGEASI